MCIQPTRLTLSLCDRSQVEQTKYSLATRVAAISIGIILALIGVLILCGVPSLSSLGTTAGALFLAVGAACIVGGTCLKCIYKERQKRPHLGDATSLENQSLQNNREVHSTNRDQNVKVNQEKPGDINHPTTGNPSPSKSYDLDAVIDRVRKAQAEKNRLTLYVGRTNEFISEFTRAGFLCFSLGLNVVETADTSRHLKIDLNDAPKMRELAHHFNRIVVDSSVLNFFHGSPWDTLTSLLVKRQSAVLMLIIGAADDRPQLAERAILDNLSKKFAMVEFKKGPYLTMAGWDNPPIAEGSPGYWECTCFEVDDPQLKKTSHSIRRPFDPSASVIG